MRTLLVVLTMLGMFGVQAPAQSLNLMPMPAKVQMGSGQLVLQPSFSVAITGVRDPRLEHAIDRFLNDLRRQLGWVALDGRITDPASATLVIHPEQAGKEVQELGEDESYKLVVTSSGAKLDAPTSLGAMRGLQTFLQLVEGGPEGFTVTAISIDDQPRSPWRGLMIDVSRHFIPIGVLERNLDGMAAVKMNVFHWHLSDDQGFRIESKKLPKLHENGSDGLYYTQEEVRALIAYARERGIRVVPEFDMPGHSTAWFAGYPELAAGPGPYEIERKFGIFDPAMDPTQEHTYKFLDEFIGEMAKLFPDKYFHIGGDEVNGKQWNANPKIQEFMRARGLKTDADLQAYFNRHVQEIVSKHGKVMEGWDEILKPELPKDIVIQSWRGQGSLAEVVTQGFRGILSQGYYLDLMWPAWRHYANDPMTGATQNLTAEQQKAILGGEACMWEEYASPDTIDSRIWPRAAAIAERLWSPQSVNDPASMYQRLEVVGQRLELLGLTHNTNYEPMLRRVAGGDDISALRVLADVVEPVKDYKREELAATPATVLDPLNRLVDAARPESQTARQFGLMIDGLLAGKATPETKAKIRSLLMLWRGNQVQLQPVAQNAFLMKEVISLSQDLSAVAAAGLQAMDYLENKQTAPESWKNTQIAIIQQAKKPKAQLLLMVAPSIEKLVEASTGR